MKRFVHLWVAMVAAGGMSWAITVACTPSPATIPSGNGTVVLSCPALDAGAGFTLGNVQLQIGGDFSFGDPMGNQVHQVFTPGANFGGHTVDISGGASSTSVHVDGVPVSGIGTAQTVPVNSQNLSSFVIAVQSTVTMGVVEVASTSAYLTYTPQAGGPGLIGAVTSLVQGDNVCNAPPSVSSFHTTDPAAFAWFAVSNAQMGNTASIQFVDPNGITFSHFDYTLSSSGHVCFIDAKLNIANTSVANQTGTWTAKILYNGSPLTSVPFTISASNSLAITTNSLPNGITGTSYSANVAASGGMAPYTFSATGLPANLSISAAGAITGTPLASGTSTVNLKVIDGANAQVTKQLSLTISPAGQGLSITTSSLSSGLAGQNYSQTVGASGGTTPYSFSATGLPSNLHISATSGNISGIPAAAGTFPVTVTVTDAVNAHASQGYSLIINGSVQPLSITTSVLPEGGTGQNYAQLVVAAGGTPPYLFSATGLPSGLNITAAGNITGTPNANGSFPVVVMVTDGANAHVTRNYTLVITSSLTITTPSLANGSVGQAYFQVVSAVGGVFPFSFRATGLRPGLIMTSEGDLSGTPSTAGSFTVVITVVDSKKVELTVEFPLIIYSQPVISTTSPLPGAVVGVPYSQTFSATGGLAPYTYFLLSGPAVVTISQGGVLSATFLEAGPVTFSVQVIDANKNAVSKTFSLTVAAPPQQVSVAPLSLQFKAPFGGELPGSQNIALSGGDAGSTFGIQIDDGQGGAAPSWLKATPLSGSVPGAIHVTALTNTLPSSGTFSGRIRISFASATGVKNGSADVAVTLTLTTAPPKLSTSPGSLRFNKADPEQTLEVHNAGGGGPINFTAAIKGSNSFITSVTPSSGQTPAVLRIKVNTGSPGARNDSIQITSSAGSASIPVPLFVPSPGPALAVAQTGFRFQTRQGSGTSTTQTIHILNVGDSGTTVTWNAEVVAGSDWLILGSTSGTATPVSRGSLLLKTGPGAATLAAGGHYALIKISAPGSQNSPQYLVGVLDVAPAGGPVSPDPVTEGFFFVGVASGSQPAAQLLEVGASSATPVKVVTSTSTSDGGKWLTLTTVNDSASDTKTAQFNVVANTTGLKAGIYTGDIAIAILNELRLVNVTLDVAPTGTILTSSNKARVAVGCTASQLAVTETGMVNNFSIPAGWPATLEMRLDDDCGSAVANGNVVASFSNGDPPITLLNDGQSEFYSATWQPGSASSSVTVTLDAAAPGLGSASAQLAGGVNANPTPAPSLVINGLLHNINPTVGAPLAPGTVSQVYGANLTLSADAPTTVPLPVSFKGVQVVIGGLSAPLYYISPTQLTIQIPSELTPNQYQALISVNGAYTLPQPIDLRPVAPGVVAFADGTLVAQHSSDFTLVSAASPAKPGEVLIVYLVGLGATSVNVPSGSATPGDRLVLANTPLTMTIDSQPVQTPFVGLTPGGVGLYQINLIVPANTRTGAVPVTITQGGIDANATTLLVQR